MIRLNKRELLFIAYFYNNAIYVGSTIFIKVTVAFPSANQKCNTQYIYIYIILLVWMKYFVSQPKSIQISGFLDGSAREYSKKAGVNGITRRLVIFTILQIVLND